MVDNRSNYGNYKILKISIAEIAKDIEMLRFVPDYLKTEKMCKNGVKKFLFVIKYVPDQFKTEETCDKVIIENGGILGFIPDCYKD